MNKQQFIDYIEKLPNEIDFTPMTVQVKAESPNADGSYRTLTKNIKFECTYTEMVHKLEEPSFSPTIIDTPISLFDQHVIRLHRSLLDLINPSYGVIPKYWGGIPIMVLAWNLLICLRDQEEPFFHTLTQDTHEILLSLGKILACLDDPSKELISTIGAPLSFKITDMLSD